MPTTLTDLVQLESIDFTCGHRNYLPEHFVLIRRRDHSNFWCAQCGIANCFSGKSDIERLRGKLTTTKDMLNSVRAERDTKEAQRRAEKAAKTKLKQRIANGVCPCCQRSFTNLHSHMQKQHPDFAEHP